MTKKDKPGLGVVVGKFNPPHLGHLHLITQGALQVEHLFVVLCDRPDQTLGIEKRRKWLVDAAPSNVTVLITPDDLPDESEPWARRTLEVLPAAPALAFTSEAYGPRWAELMGAEHITVDLPRITFPISGTRLRTNLRENFHWLVPAARAELAHRVVLIGAESSGKSTMADALAKELQTVWVPEYGRSYWEGRRYLQNQHWSSDEFLHIARAQQSHEDALARQTANGVLIADTNELVTAVWHKRYTGDSNAELDTLTAGRVPALYLACRADFGWVQDGTRESENHRETMQQSMEARAAASGVPVVTLTGSHENRLATALEAINKHCTFDVLI